VINNILVALHIEVSPPKIASINTVRRIGNFSYLQLYSVFRYLLT